MIRFTELAGLLFDAFIYNKLGGDKNCYQPALGFHESLRDLYDLLAWDYRDLNSFLCDYHAITRSHANLIHIRFRSGTACDRGYQRMMSALYSITGGMVMCTAINNSRFDTDITITIPFAESYTRTHEELYRLQANIDLLLFSISKDRNILFNLQLNDT